MLSVCWYVWKQWMPQVACWKTNEHEQIWGLKNPYNRTHWPLPWHPPPLTPNVEEEFVFKRMLFQMPLTSGILGPSNFIPFSCKTKIRATYVLHTGEKPRSSTYNLAWNRLWQSVAKICQDFYKSFKSVNPKQSVFSRKTYSRKTYSLEAF